MDDDDDDSSVISMELDAPEMTINENSTTDIEVFRFKDLPAEVRNKVYANLLYPVLPKMDRDFEYEDDVINLNHLFATAILLVDRQIYGEARDVMIKKNQFVRVSFRGLSLPETLSKQRMVPVSYWSAVRNDALRKFQSAASVAVMTYTVRDPAAIEEHGIYHADLNHHAILRYEDLDTLMETVGHYLTNPDALPLHVHHKVVLHNPLKKTGDTRFKSAKFHDYLLQPFLDHLDGIDHFAIKGSVSSIKASTISCLLRIVIAPEPDAFLAVIHKLDREATYFWSQLDTATSCTRWTEAGALLRRLPTSTAWLRMRTPEFADQLARLLHHVHTRNLEPLASDMSLLADDADDVADAVFVVTELSAVAMDPGSPFDSHWMPSPRQMADVCLGQARALRAVKKINAARRALREASHYVPNDPEIEKEAEELVKTALEMAAQLA